MFANMTGNLALMPDPLPQQSSIFSAIATAFRKNRLPCLLLNILVVILVASYYYWPPVAGMWQAIGEFKSRWSFAFSCVSTILAAVVMPFCLQWAMGTPVTADRWQKFGWGLLFWGYRGMEIDLFYHLQRWLFGDGHDLGTLAIKVMVDQFIVSTIWFVPTYVIALRWIDQGGSWRQLWASLDRDFWTRTCPTVLVTNWLVWLPALVLVYALPAPLQFPLFSIIMCFFILVVTLLTAPPNKNSAAR